MITDTGCELSMTIVSFEEKQVSALRRESQPPSSPSSLPQVDLRFLTMLTAIATQGAISRETQNGYYVKSYKLEVSTNGEDWMVYRHGKNHKVNPFPHLTGMRGRCRTGEASFQAAPFRGRSLFSEAQMTDGGIGDAGPENALPCAKVIGKYHFSNNLAAVASCRAGGERERARESELTECSLTANEGENLFPVLVSPHRIH